MDHIILPVFAGMIPVDGRGKGYAADSPRIRGDDPVVEPTAST